MRGVLHPLRIVVVSVCVAVLAALLGPAGLASSAVQLPWMDPSLPPDERAELLLAQMTLEEKIEMLHGEFGPYAFFNAAIPRLGIPALTMADGPAGVRVANPDVNQGEATALPAPMALAATWDPRVARRYGDVIGGEAFATGHNVQLGPAVDIARVPVGGRTFEAYGEDPLLQGRTAVGTIRGIQRHPVVATIKHYNLNNQEFERLTISSEVDERTVQEIYVPPYEAGVRKGRVGAAMCSFNRVNGVYACEHRHLLADILKRQLGFRGWVMSDFGATHSTVEAANAGLDQEMPDGQFFDQALLAAVRAGQVSIATINDKVRRILRSMFRLGLFDHPVQISPLPERAHGRQARQIAGKGIVLLKNAGGLLPLSSRRLRSMAVIGADADNASAAGGGSALVKPTYTVSPLAGIRERAGADVRVRHAEGTDPVSAAALLPGPPAVPSSVLTPAGAGPDVQGLRAQYWANTSFQGAPALVRTDRQAALNLGVLFALPGFNASSLPPVPPELVGGPISVRWTGTITAPATGDYTLALTSLGRGRLYLDGELLIDHWAQHDRTTRSATVRLVAGQPHAIRVDYAADHPSVGGLVGAEVKLGWRHPARAIPPAARRAAALAKASDVAVVVVRDYETEQGDRPNLVLPNEQDQLIRAVAAANPRTVVVLNTGAPVTMPWLGRVPAVLEAWYAGQEQGNAIADVLFGAVNPSGRLPVTFPRSLRATPIRSQAQYPGVNGRIHYTERIFVGYRGYDQFGIRPLFPFGYGLSYTSFAYGRLRVKDSHKGKPARVSFTVRNTGRRSGAEVAQVYVGRLPTGVLTPPKQLAGFARVAPGPGERDKVTIEVSRRSLSYWSTSANRWVTPTGRVPIYIGSSSRDIRLVGAIEVR
jgi:beta-glucosidase